MGTKTMTGFERTFKVMIQPWVVVLLMGCLLLTFLYIDRPITIFFRDAGLNTQYSWLVVLTQLGRQTPYLILLFLLVLTSRFILKNIDWERRFGFLMLCILSANLVCLVLKVTLGRARPELFFSEHLYGFYGPHKDSLFWSFPSGHTITIMSLMFGLSALYPRYMMGFVLSGLLVTVSRILLVQHYVSDVFMASYLALIVVGIIDHCWTQRLDNQ